MTTSKPWLMTTFHFKGSDGKPACHGYIFDAVTTTVARTVNCGRCRRTNAFRAEGGR